MAFVDFAARKKAQAPFIIKHIEAWGGEVRLNRLPASDVLDLVEMQEDFAKSEDGEIIDKRQALEFAVEFCALTIADDKGVLQYDSDDGRESLNCEMMAVSEITNYLTEMHGIGDSPQQKKTA